jgi:hypothetical protein
MIRSADEPREAKLPFPTRPLKCGNDVVDEYIIPDDKRQEVLELLYIFDGVPSLDEQMFDLHEGKLFTVREYRVTWENGQNWLVSPYYPTSGGTVIDWLPPEAAEEGGEEDDEEEGDSEKDGEA